ncbi:hypothetical protein L1987_43540 [Smallanthus sonchifolius]|uniref:Uncharacterized protein n=1 Tax=Smallanthus sonchifolius TaxID=185202 RepID=A0ACB9GMX0_9ASTR|nr:hypothetical protein L1987_43540 [Smallanthus sonchifolius]
MYYDGSDFVSERGNQEPIRVFATNELKWLTREDLYALGRMKMLYEPQDQEDVDFCYKCIRGFAAIMKMLYDPQDQEDVDFCYKCIRGFAAM